MTTPEQWRAVVLESAPGPSTVQAMNELLDLLKAATLVQNDLHLIYHDAVRAQMPDEFLESIVKNSTNAFGIRRSIEAKCNDLR